MTPPAPVAAGAPAGRATTLSLARRATTVSSAAPARRATIVSSAAPAAGIEPMGAPTANRSPLP